MQDILIIWLSNTAKRTQDIQPRGWFQQYNFECDMKQVLSILKDEIYEFGNLLHHKRLAQRLDIKYFESEIDDVIAFSYSVLQLKSLSILEKKQEILHNIHDKIKTLKPIKDHVYSYNDKQFYQNA